MTVLYRRNKSRCHLSCDLENQKEPASQRSERRVFYIQDLAGGWDELRSFFKCLEMNELGKAEKTLNSE